MVIGHLLEDVATEALRFHVLVLRLQPVSECNWIAERQRESREPVVRTDHALVVGIQLQLVKKELRLDIGFLLKFL